MQVSVKEMMALIGKYRLPMCNFSIIKDKKEISSLKLKYPVAAKLMSRDIIHKTEAGAVRLGIPDSVSLAAAMDALIAISGRRKARFDGILVQEMQTGLELIIGAKRDPQFGPVILFGLGGIYVEIFKETSIRIAPLTESDAAEMINDTKIGKALAGARGKSYAVNDIIEIIVKVSRIMEKENTITELDFNPVIVNESGAKIVDMRVL